MSRKPKPKAPRKPRPPVVFITIGRPPKHGQTGARYNVYLPPNVVQALRKLGDGNLSAGIVKAATLT
jgi:hypothetical protein